MPTNYQKLAMSKPVGRVLDSKLGKSGVKMGNKIIKGAKKAGKVATYPLKWAGNQIEKEARMNQAKDDRYRAQAPYGAYGTPSYRGGAMSDKEKKLLGSFKKGGKVKKTGKYKLHKGEVVVPVKKVKKMKKVMKSAMPGDLFNKFAKKKK